MKALLALILLTPAAFSADWQPAAAPMLTRWGRELKAGKSGVITRGLSFSGRGEPESDQQSSERGAR